MSLKGIANLRDLMRHDSAWGRMVGYEECGKSIMTSLIFYKVCHWKGNCNLQGSKRLMCRFKFGEFEYDEEWFECGNSIMTKGNLQMYKNLSSINASFQLRRKEKERSGIKSDLNVVINPITTKGNWNVQESK